MEHRVRYVTTSGGVRTRVLEAGSGAPVLLLHGTGAHLEVFLRNVEALARVRRVVAIDLLGHGLTDLPKAEEPFDWKAVGEHVVETMDALGISSAAMIGEALGAQTAQWLAARFPERVEAVILSGACILPKEDEQEPAVSESQLAFQDLTRRVLDHPADVGLMRERMAWLHLDDSLVDEEMLALRMGFWAREGFIEAHRRLLASLRTARYDPRTSIGERDLSSMRVPTMLLWTRENPLQDLSAAQRLASRIPSARLVTFTESAMWPQFDESGRFNDVVVDWLRRI